MPSFNSKSGAVYNFQVGDRVKIKSFKELSKTGKPVITEEPVKNFPGRTKKFWVNIPAEKVFQFIEFLEPYNERVFTRDMKRCCDKSYYIRSVNKEEGYYTFDKLPASLRFTDIMIERLLTELSEESEKIMNEIHSKKNVRKAK